MSDVSPPRPAKATEERSSFLYYHDPVSELAIVVGEVYVDSSGDAWVRINGTDLAASIGVDDIDGVALQTRDEFIRPQT